MFNHAKPVSTFLTFNGNAEEAMNFYLATFPDAKKSPLPILPNQNKAVTLAKY
ncbi:hypothetical protein LIIV107777_00435 [Listeria ivanovii subsp. ivanovii]